MENFSQKFSPCINIINRIFRDMKIHFYTVMKPEFLGSHRDQTSKCILITLAVTVDWWDRSTHSTVLCVRSSLSLYHSSIRCEYKYNDTPHFARISGRGAGGGGGLKREREVKVLTSRCIEADHRCCNSRGREMVNEYLWERWFGKFNLSLFYSVTVISGLGNRGRVCEGIGEEGESNRVREQTSAPSSIPPSSSTILFSASTLCELDD